MIFQPQREKGADIMINITDIRVTLSGKSRGKLKATASLVIDDCFAVHDIKIISGKGGVFVAMPAIANPDGTFRDIVHPLNSSTRAEICRMVLDAYEKHLTSLPRDDKQ